MRMALTFDEEVQLLQLKTESQKEILKLKHEAKMEELEAEIRYAEIIGGEINGSSNRRDIDYPGHDKRR